MANKLSEDQLIELCEKHNVVYTGEESKPKGQNKHERYIKFICPKHEKYGEQSRKIYDFRRLNHICKYCNHGAIKETFVDEMNEINPQIEILSKYKNWDTKIKCKCKICGNIWETVPSVLLYGGGCIKCGYIRGGEKHKQGKAIIFKKRMEEITPDIEMLEEYKGANVFTKFKCKLDDTIWETTPTRLIRKEACCPTCVKTKLHGIYALSQEEFREKVSSINPYIIPISKYTDTHTPVMFKCLIHDYVFEMKPTSILYKYSRCPKCSRTSGEVKLENLLDKYNIKFYRQHIFPDCKNINVLEFDTYCYEINMVIEYQGRQHYEPVDFAGRGEEWAKEQFEVNQKRDQIKRDYCKENNITMVEIPYWEYENMEEYLKQYII